MKNPRIESILFLTLFAASSLIMSCKSNTTAPAPPTPSIMDTGSTITVFESSSGTTDTIVYTVFDTTLKNPNTSGGKVIGLRGLRASNNTTSMIFLSYETNGDVSIFPNPAGDPVSWLTLPFVSQSTINTKFIQGGVPPDTISTSAVWNKAGSYVISGKAFNTDTVTVTITDANGSSSPSVSKYHYTYLPSLNIIGIENFEGGPVDAVIGYTIK